MILHFQLLVYIKWPLFKGHKSMQMKTIRSYISNFAECQYEKSEPRLNRHNSFKVKILIRHITLQTHRHCV